jgi:hypothetical protein
VNFRRLPVGLLLNDRASGVQPAATDPVGRRAKSTKLAAILTDSDAKRARSGSPCLSLYFLKRRLKIKKLVFQAMADTVLWVEQRMMTEAVLRPSLLGIAGAILPAGYIATCFWLYRQKTWWFAYLAYFILFGALGGWVFAFAMSPSGLTATSVVFLVTVALVACVTSSVVLAFRRRKSRAEWMALISLTADYTDFADGFIRDIR